MSNPVRSYHGSACSDPSPHGSASSSLDHASSHPGTSVLKDEDQTTTCTRTGRGHGLGALYGDQQGGGGGGGGVQGEGRANVNS